MGNLNPKNKAEAQAMRDYQVSHAKQQDAKERRQAADDARRLERKRGLDRKR